MRHAIRVGIGLGILAVVLGEAAIQIGVPSPSRTNLLFAMIGIAALSRGARAGLVVAVIAWFYQGLTIDGPSLSLAYTGESQLRLLTTAFAMPAVALVLGAFQDTLEQVRRSDAAHREAAETLAVIVSAAPAAVVTTDVSGRVKLWNAAAAQMFGWTSAEVVGTFSPIVPADRLTEDRAARAGAAAGPAHDLRTVRVTRDGRLLDVSLSIATIRDRRGASCGTVDTIVDITDHNRQEALRAGAQRAELLGRLTAGVAHDFANVLAAISGYRSLVAGAIPVSHVVQADLEAIDHAVERGTALTRQLLAYGRTPPESREPVDLGDVVAGVLPMLKQLLRPACVLVHEVTTDLGHVQADPGQLEQVIANLVVNARDAMPSGGQVTVRTANVERDETFARLHPGSVPGRYVSLTVADTGQGIDPAVMTSIFEPYFTTKRHGTGLGLATVRGIVQQAGGYVSMKSEPGEGTVFVVDLPRIDAADEDVELDAEACAIPA
jgi:PAS domain S-box-containing protein